MTDILEFPESRRIRPSRLRQWIVWSACVLGVLAAIGMLIQACIVTVDQWPGGPPPQKRPKPLPIPGMEEIEEAVAVGG